MQIVPKTQWLSWWAPGCYNINSKLIYNGERMPDMEKIMVYGTRWCPDCRRSRQVLDHHNIPFTWIDIEDDAGAAAYIQKVNGGYRSVPTILFPVGSVLVEPADAALEKKL